MTSKQKFINIIISVIAIVAVSLGGYFYYQIRILKTDSQSVAKKEADSLVNKISQFYLLPEGESPTIATVSDPEILKNQSFFSRAEKGDKVLIYTKSSKAILYRPSIDKIIEIAPISNDTKTVKSPDTSVDTTNTPTTTTTKTPTKK